MERVKNDNWPVTQKTLLPLLACLLWVLPLKSQHEVSDNTFAGLPNPVNSATMFAIGRVDMYDTYLSPLKYTGTSYRVVNERMSRKSWFDSNFIKQQIIDLEFAYGQNPSNTASELWLLLDYRLGGHYEFINKGDFRLRAGGLWNISSGVLYNQRNGNNPASARAYTNLNLSVMALYKWQTMTFRWQMDTPFLGVLFSPKYGQSYYEISLGNSVGVLNVASLHNQRALRNYMTVDIPAGRFMIRTGYLGSYYQTSVHSLKTHTYSHSLVVGFVNESVNLSGSKARKRADWNSSYY